MKRILAGMAAALLAAVSFFPVSTKAISAESAIVVDAQTGRVLYEKQPDKQMLIASTTKIMTALVVCERCNVLDRVRIPKEAVGIEGSSMYLREGEILTVQELLYGLMLHSGNDAATALAIYCGGTVEGFVELMNDKAQQLNLHDTHFANPHGLDAPGHYSTASDMAKLGIAAMENSIFAKTVSTKTVNISGRTLRNHNKLLWQLPGADGIKTGYTKASGRTLVSSATRLGRRLVAVTMNAPNDWKDHIQMIDSSFADYQSVLIVAAGDVLGRVEIAGGEDTFVELVALEDFDYLLAADETVTVDLVGPGFVYAPVVEGQSAGYANICLGLEQVGKVRIVYGKTVETVKQESRSFWERLLGKGG